MELDVPEYDPTTALPARMDMQDGSYLPERSRGIKWLWRRGMSEFCSDDSTEVKIALIDSLEYFFDPEGRLDSIYDHTLHAKGYYPGITGIEGSFGYDPNGNLINDPYKKLQYSYNIFNLPNGVFTTKGDMGMQYDAESIKLRKTLPNGKVRDYFGEIEYEDQAISIIHHAEGLIRKTGEEYRYDYVINDHLGNARVTFSDFNEDGKIQYLTEIMQENHYYPFGLNMEGLWTYGYGGSIANRFQYNGKERGDEIVLHDPVRDFDVEFGLYDYGARLYDPAIARFPSVDRLAEKYYYQSPYTYAANNPIRFIDVNGDSILPTQALINNAAAFAGFNEFINSDQGKSFAKLFGEGGKYESIPVVFDLLDNSEKDDQADNGLTTAIAVNAESGEESVLRPEHDARPGDRSSLIKGETIKYQIDVSPYGNNPIDSRDIANTGLRFLHESQHVLLLNNDLQTKGKLINGAVVQHQWMKLPDYKLFKQRYNFYRKRRPDLSSNTIKTAVNGFRN
jgi:RHS repeat-associated protein